MRKSKSFYMWKSGKENRVCQMTLTFCFLPSLNIIMRQSVAPIRSSLVLSEAAQAAALARLQEKKKEIDAVAALDRATADLVERIAKLSDDCDVMAESGDSGSLAYSVEAR